MRCAPDSHIGDDDGRPPGRPFGIERAQNREAHESTFFPITVGWAKRSVPTDSIAYAGGRVLSRCPPTDCYSTFSTYTRMVPPHERPTFQAVSSATPNSSVLGLPLAITSSASVTTAPSTQPPDTEPRKLPSVIDHQIGADRPRRRTPGLHHRRQRHAAPLPPPVLGGLENVFVARQHPRASCPLTSVSAEYKGALHPGPMPACSLKPPFAASPSDRGAARRSPPRRPASARHKSSMLGEIVHRAELVHMRQDRLDAARLGFEAVEPQQRVEPDQAPAGAVQPVDLEGQAVVGVALQPVGDQEHDRPAAEHPARPLLVEGGERGGDAGPARPVGDAAPNRPRAPRRDPWRVSARVTLVRRVPNRNVCTRFLASVTA